MVSVQMKRGSTHSMREGTARKKDEIKKWGEKAGEMGKRGRGDGRECEGR